MPTQMVMSASMIKEVQEKSAVAVKLVASMRQAGWDATPESMDRAGVLAGRLVDQVDQRAGMISQENGQLLMAPGGRDAYRAMLLATSTTLLAGSAFNNEITDDQVSVALNGAAQLVDKVLAGVQQDNVVEISADSPLGNVAAVATGEFARRQNQRNDQVNSTTSQPKPSNRP